MSFFLREYFLSVLKKNTRGQEGQTLLIIVLVMVIALTVGLSLAFRSTVNVRTSLEQEHSQRAFSAAEAGIERVLKTNTPITSQINIGGGANTATIQKVEITPAPGATVYVARDGSPIEKDDGEDIWLAPKDANGRADVNNGYTGSLDVYWELTSLQPPAANCNQEPAMEMILIFAVSTSDIRTQRFAFDPCVVRRARNKFTAPSAGAFLTSSQGVSYSYAYKTPAPIAVANGLILRIVPLYQKSHAGVKVTSGPSLPGQGDYITSTGQFGNAVRKVTYFRKYPELPSELFQYILFCSKSGDCLL